MTRAIREVSIQRVRMRNEQFDFQMTDREIAGWPRRTRPRTARRRSLRPAYGASGSPSSARALPPRMRAASAAPMPAWPATTSTGRRWPMSKQ